MKQKYGIYIKANRDIAIELSNRLSEENPGLTIKQFLDRNYIQKLVINV